MANNSNFTGWSGTTFDISKLNISERTQNPSQKNSKITTGPVSINTDRPKVSKITPGVKQTPVASVNLEPNPDFSKATKSGSTARLSSTVGLQSTTLPFTAGTIDTSFPNGINTGFDDDVHTSKVQPDGKILVGGNFGNYEYNGTSYYAPYLIRLNPDGSPDFDFMYTFHADEDGWYLGGQVRTIDIQSDGKIILGGDFGSYNANVSYSSNRIIRFNSDGTYDDTFFVGYGFNDTVYKILVLSDDKILVGGVYYSFNTVDNWRIIRLNSNGTKDVTFNTGDGIDWDDYGVVYDIVVQSDGKIILGGDFYNYNGNNANYIVRLNTDGSYDNTFIIGDGFNDIVYALALQSDDKIIVGGNFNDYDYINLYDGYIVRLSANGQIDTLFGLGFNDIVRSLYVQSDDKILIGGQFNTFYIDNNSSWSINQIVRFQSDCTIDYSFDIDDTLTNQVLSITLDSDNKIYIGGSFVEDGAPYLLNRFGRLNNSILEYPYVYAMESCTQPLMGETLTYVVGSMTPLDINLTYSLQSVQNPSITVCGFINDDFYPSNIVEYTSVNSYVNCEEAYTSNYKLIVFEDCLANFQDIPVWTVDNKFEIGDVFYIDSVVDLDGRVFLKFAATITDIIPWSGGTGPFGPVWEYFPPVNYITYSSCDEAIEANGVIYEAFSCLSEETTYPLIHIPYYNTVTLFIPTADNPVKFLNNYLPTGPYEFISGGTPEIFSTIKIADGEFCELGLSKISPEGILNNYFGNTGFLGNLVYTMVEQPDGKILVGGNFDEYLENSVGNFMRINSDGSLDDTFNSVYCNQPIWSTQTPFENTTSGSIYFDGTPLCELNANTDVAVWDLGNNNLTFEWFQYFTGDLTHLTPTLFDYSSNDLRVYFSNGEITVVIDGDNYSYGLNSTIKDVWCHIAVTRYYDPEEDVYIWRVFQNGIQLGQFNYSFTFGQSEPLIIGNNVNPYNNGGFNGYITNFRVNNGAALYTENFVVPTEPLDPNYNPDGSNTVLCLSVNNESTFYDDNCDDEIGVGISSPGYFRNGGFDNYVRAIALQPDGKILVGGNFNSYNNTIAGKIIRLNSDGTIDQGFTYNSEFNGIVRAIAVQRDGKIVVGGGFSYYYDFYCPQIVRLNSDGTPDPTFVMGDAFVGGNVYTINIETIRNNPFYNDNGPITYTENIIIGGWFNSYNEIQCRGIVKLSPTGEILPDFGVGFNVNEGGMPRVNQILMQPDGKVVIIGGADGGELRDYNNTWIPQNIVRLEKDIDGIYQIDTTFTTRDFDNTGGFNNGVQTITLLPNGKYMVGGSFNYYGDNNNITVDIPRLVRLNSDGTLDTTFTFELTDDNVNKVLLLSSGILLVGGRFETPKDLLLELFIGDDYKLRSFTTCDGTTSNIFLPTGYEPETLLNLVYDGDFDDDNFSIELPLDFDVNFLGTNYTSVFIGSNSYLTFGAGSDNHDFSIPDQINSDGPGLPGVYISSRQYLDNSSCMDSAMWKLYTGTTDNGNTTIIRFEGNNDFEANQGDTNLVYNFKFYKDQSNYFDLIIEQNVYFCNDDPTGGTSDGSDNFIDDFDCSPGNSYRIDSNGFRTVLTYSPVVNIKSIKANVNERVAVCGTVGDIITTPNTGGGIGGSMYFDGNMDTMVQIDNGGGQFGFNGGNDFTIEWFQYYEGGSNSRPFSIGVYNNPSEMIGMSFEGTVYLWVNNGGIDTNITNNDLLNGWHHIAITRNFNGGDRTWRVFLDGVEKLNVINNQDTSNTDTLTLGNQLNNDGRFQGYITNFRVNNLTALYTSNFEVPTQPLTCNANAILTMDATNEAGLITDSCNQQTILSSTGVVWSNNTPFSNLVDFSLFTATNTTSYNTCSDCGQTYQTKLFVRDGVNPDKIDTYQMTLNSINNVLTNGPIFTTRGPECYEILKYTY